jgi:hypothetical protein
LGGERTVARKPTDTAHLNLRYPEALRRRLERAGKSNGRSLNSEIVHRLEQSFRREDFQEWQDPVNDGLMEIMGVVADVAKRIPVRTFKTPGLLDPGNFASKASEQPPPTDKEEDSK